MKKLGVLVLIFMIILPVNSLQAEEVQFHFNNWPLASFENRTVLVPFNNDTHKGVDIAANFGEDVLAVAEGYVYYVTKSRVGIRHEVGDGVIYETTYLHLSDVLVGEGQYVLAGNLIGKTGEGNLGKKSGKDENVTKPHLHFGLDLKPEAKVWDKDKYGDPLLYGPVAVQPEKIAQPDPEPRVQPQPQPQIEPPVDSPPSSPLPVVENQSVETVVEAPATVSLAPKQVIETVAKTPVATRFTPRPVKINQKPVLMKKSIAIAKVRLQALPVNTAIITSRQITGTSNERSVAQTFRLPHKDIKVSATMFPALLITLLLLALFSLLPLPNSRSSKLEVRTTGV